MTITDRDRAAALACNGHNDVCEAIAQAREEGRQEEREGWKKLREVAMRHADNIQAALNADRARGEV